MVGRVTTRRTKEAVGTIVAQSSTTYDSHCRVASTTDGAGNVTTYAYDSFGRPSVVTRADTRTQTTTFDDASHPVSIVSFENLTSTAFRDIFGRVTASTSDGLTTATTWESAPEGKPLASSDGTSTTEYTWDDIGRRTSATAQGATTAWAWDDSTRTATTNIGGRITTTTQDAAGRVISAKDGLDRTTTISYAINTTAKTLTTTATDPASQTTVTVSDGLGRMLSSTDGNGDTTTYAYDALGRQTSYTNARGHTFSFEYDAAGRRTKRTEPDSTWQGYTYDLAGNQLTHRKADGPTATWTYNNRNQPVSKTWTSSGESTAWTYDTYGRLISVENQNSIVSHSYISGSNRVQDATTTIKGLSNLTRATTAGYDGYNRLSSVATTPALATIGYSYHSSGHASEGKLAGVTNDSPPPLATYTYAATGEISSVTLENGLTSTWTRDAAGQATAFLTTDASSNIVSGVTHGYDAASRRTWAAYEDSLGQSYAYDDAGQVIAAKVGISNPSTTPPGTSPTHSFAYDTAGNRTSSSAFSATTSYTANNVNAYTVITGGGFTTPSPTHDAKGNCLILPRPDGSNLSMTWDKEDRLVSAGGATYVYDPFGRLIWKRHTVSSVTTDEICSWHSWTLISREIRQGSTAVETFRYTWGLDLSNTFEGAGGVGGLLAIEHAVGSSSSWAIRYAHADANGNILCLTDSGGNASARYRYSPFGELLTASDLDSSGWATRNIHGFSTKPLDETIGLHYYGYRWYDAPTGRWPSRDPIEESGGMNLYGFVGNNSIIGIDLLGLVSLPDEVRKEIKKKVIEATHTAMSAITDAVSGILAAKAMTENADEIASSLETVCDGLTGPSSVKLLTISASESGERDLGGFEVFFVTRRTRTLLGSADSSLSWTADYSADLWVTCCCPKGGNKYEPFLRRIDNINIAVSGNVNTKVTLGKGLDDFDFAMGDISSRTSFQPITLETPCE